MSIVQAGAMNARTTRQLRRLGTAFVMLSLITASSGQSLVDVRFLEGILGQGFSKPRSQESPTGKETTREYITQFFKELNADNFHQQDFQVPGGEPGRNFIWILPGTRFGSADDAVLVIGAHYDSSAFSMFSQGVNDNGSGMTALLEVARALSQQNKYRCARLNSIIFVAFDVEQDIPLGSSQFINNYLLPQFLQKYQIPLARFQGAIILDTVMNWDPVPESQTVPQWFSLVSPAFVERLKARQNRGNFILAGARQDETSLLDELNTMWATLPNSRKYLYDQVTLPFSGRPSNLPAEQQQLFAALYLITPHSFWDHNSPYATNGLKAVLLTDSAYQRGYMRDSSDEDGLSHVTVDRLQFLAKISETLARFALEKATGEDDLQCTGAPDVDECFVRNGACEHKCENTQGSFTCSCNTGYVLAADGKSCHVPGYQSLVDPRRAEQTLRQRFSKIRNEAQQDDKEAAREFIIDFFKRLNANDFDQQDFPSGNNLIWMLPGKRFATADDALLVIGAHYDTTTLALSPGVNDNGSGVTVLLEVAKALSQQKKYRCERLNSILFVAFDKEEVYGFVGSDQFVNEYLVPKYLQKYGIPPSRFQGAIILDTVLNWDPTPDAQSMPFGYELLFPDLASLLVSRQSRGDFLFAVGRQDDTALMDGINQQWTAMPQPEKYWLASLVVPISGRPDDLTQEQREMLRDLARSDHYSFYNHQSTYAPNGLKAVFLTDTDADECLVEKGGCDHNCENTQGGFTCSCRPGYFLTPDRKTCTAGGERLRGLYQLTLLGLLASFWVFLCG